MSHFFRDARGRVTRRIVRIDLNGHDLHRSGKRPWHRDPIVQVLGRVGIRPELYTKQVDFTATGLACGVGRAGHQRCAAPTSDVRVLGITRLEFYDSEGSVMCRVKDATSWAIVV